MSKIKYPSTSKETKKLKYTENISSSKKKKFVGLTPVDDYYCDCRKIIEEMYKKVASGDKPYFIECPKKNNKKYKKYKIECQNCKNIVAEIFATDDTLTDFCDFHYITETDGDHWFGAFTVQLSPIDGKIGIECSCGQDTRDFRANNTLPKKLSYKLTENLKGKEFGKADSKFKAIKL